ncbi:MAG: hypothetical protein J3R72DRAFT_484745 [Linnemannia gamsii]|nr:MAG: hypothetical protein J3R72DRAFT_484745 [Linnemannia gamsii]
MVYILVLWVVSTRGPDESRAMRAERITGRADRTDRISDTTDESRTRIQWCMSHTGTWNRIRTTPSGTLQQELIAKYLHLEVEIASQNDIGVLNYLDMIYSDEPDEDTLSAIQETINKDEFKSLFLEYSVGHIDDIDEDDEETEDEKKGLD